MHRRALIRAVCVSAVFVAWAPFIGEIRLALRNAFPTTFIPVVAVSIAIALVVPCLVLVARIRTRRLLRYSVITLALAMVVFYWLVMRTGILEVDSVELFHFLQYGVVGTLFYVAFASIGDVTVFPLALLAGALVGTSEEWVQWIVPTRVGEARDIYLDVFAASCGLLFGVGLRPPESFSRGASHGSRRRLGGFAVAAVLWFAIFYHAAHLGYEIRDHEIGVSFVSTYAAEELRVASADRAARWRTNPPIRLRPLSIEDFFLTDASDHVLHRNRYYEAGQFDIAWKENQILEKHYDPFLDVRSFTSGVLHRWPPAQRAEVEGKRNPRAPFFDSPANRVRYVIWPTKRQFWLGVALVVVLTWWAARERRGGRVK